MALVAALYESERLYAADDEMSEPATAMRLDYESSID